MEHKSENKFVEAMKKWGYYVVTGCMVLAIGITLAVTLSTTPKNEDPVVQTGTHTATFASPLLSLEIVKDFSGSVQTLNETLGRYETFTSIAFKGETSPVFAVLDGKVASVETSYLNGTVITLEHANGLTTTYGSLDEDVDVKKGDEVTKNQKIGSTSNSSKANAYLGDHLNFAVTFEGANVDPDSYLELSNK